VLGKDVALAVVDLDDVGHVTRVDVDGLTRELRNSRRTAIVSVEEVPDIGIDRSVIDIDAQVWLEDRFLLIRELFLVGLGRLIGLLDEEVLLV
jgi:hypothetical protein